MKGDWVVLVALGGAAGAVLRLLIATAIGTHHLFPWATLWINIAGCFAIGIIWGFFGQTEWFTQWGRMLLVVGLLGGFTTFSTFSLEALSLLQVERYVDAISYVLVSVLSCLGSVYVGERIGQTLLP